MHPRAIVPTDAPWRNDLILALDPFERANLTRHLSRVHVPLGKSVYAGEERKVTSLFFPEDAVFSLTAETAHGSSIELATVGREGMAGGVAVAVGAESLPYRMTCDYPGHALKVSRDDIEAAIRRDPHLAYLTRRHTQYEIFQLAQAGLCSRFHTGRQRLAKWLLLMSDRVGASTYSVTHEMLALWLGGPRPLVSLTAREFSQGGLIRYSRGTLTLLDRQALRSAACECYDVLSDALTRLKADLPLFSQASRA